MQRRLAAILAADVVGYSRLIRGDEEGTLTAWRDILANLVEPAIDGHNGRIFKTMGDGLLVEFSSAVDAVRSAVEIQQALAGRQSVAGTASADGAGDGIVLRIGINLGDVVIDGDEIQGDGVNIAARLEGLADPGGICLSGSVHEQVRDRVADVFEDLGRKTVKNIDRPVRAWRWQSGDVRAAGDAPVADKPSIAVLAFDNMSGDPEQGYFADGIAEDVITDLSKVSGLTVIARNSSFAYRGTSPDIRLVCRELGVRFVLEGSIRKAANRVRINAQLIDGASGGHVWADRFDRDLADIFAVQDEVTREIVAALKVRLTVAEEQRRETRRKVDPDAYDHLMRGKAALFEFTAASTAEARKQIERAAEIDQEMAIAHAALSLLSGAEYVNGWNDSGPETPSQMLELAERAIGLDPAEPLAHHAVANAHLWLGNFEVSEGAARKAIELNPNFAGAYVALGQVLDFTGRHELAVEALDEALRLDPLYDMALQFRGRARFALEHYDEAAADFEQRIAMSPNTDISRAFLASIYGLAGRNDDALRLWSELKDVSPDFSVERFRRVLPDRYSEVLDRLVEGLRQAGVAV